MRTILALVLVLFVLVPAARADVIETCPDGQRFESNPVPEGAMHHAGGRCVEDEAAGGCAIGHGGGSGSAVVLMLAALALVAARRR
ncbi:MYXO-CTERM sorting domain-containing protein [Sandaracinus amylolyticus]|uniref:MYXO-CTERM domain-containing protein n=1 Tax=Sandaracinus amylolyticus TaxID=927083 RepID=A0A0F6YGD4_9BACT|nr:MYXO-CTERM sorting domain-containing protein [Sandaracinus amylolyticus]AKF03810.1 hypothetical protein DB32_000959 [Sandaracinus amylolyticus]